MGISPWYVGQTAPSLDLSFTIESGAALSLAGATLILIIRNTKTLINQRALGAFEIIDQLGGEATYTFDPQDVAQPGQYQLIFKVVVAGQIYICDPVAWNVLSI